MKKSLILAIPALLLAASCAKTLPNVDLKSPSAVPGVYLVTSAERSLARSLSSTNQNGYISRLLVQYWTETTYNDEATYNLANRTIPDNVWTAYYQGALGNLNEAKRLISANGGIDAGTKANQLACVDVLAVHAWHNLVDTFGNVPYTQALDINNKTPVYDDAATIYTDLLKRLDADIAALKANPTAGSLGSADLIYNGDIPSWIRYANSLKLRLAMTTYDVDPARASTLVQQAAPNVFHSNSDAAQLAFESTNPNTNPLYEDLVQSGRYDYVGTNVFIDKQLVPTSDPRLPIYFQPVGGKATYAGAPYGPATNYSLWSNPGVILHQPTLPAMFLSYYEVQFLLAEAAARGINVGSSASDLYNNAVTASITYWENIAGVGNPSVDAPAYLAQPSVTYATATGDFKQKIGIQKWIALYNQPTQAWTEWRRLDYPKLQAPAVTYQGSGIPLRYFYPNSEQNLNNANRQAAATAIGAT
ncbi:SusD/RagB family nutrient-binding outer membrane lipoprotein [Hymenobacter sp. BRD67]|uniref:SusD/RagB family nutrient-binding outer membrane lipoprotein n=1 Tax=Hymenobacter sp. BRD67 TaxID=2675877 RepID=UPI0015665F91|nr:SusD/RagB family nutrient-binding outer membrane lipoprotein [Hymenobacter sp. BRD67]QKG51333.1 SusD/RagB family nutrient-binding outer membrane lipoprotein [Hymenobacter sp. BRD67]